VHFYRRYYGKEDRKMDYIIEHELQVLPKPIVRDGGAEYLAGDKDGDDGGGLDDLGGAARVNP
jgi:hypothetical protein